MRARYVFSVGLILAGLPLQAALAQSASRGQAASPGQARPAASANTLPQPPSGGQPTGAPAAGAPTDAEKDAEAQAKRSTQICKGC